ncbi:unnamed protein product [Gordionus sp. m RMFG-2023]|uniref:uncharacterized protein LOC135923419 n=1 Tax=Gordionus sp. m RMFG-2023 TaxID=3053472 RepID=UPI0030E31B6F
MNKDIVTYDRGYTTNRSFVKLTRYEAIGFVYIFPVILILGLIKNYILCHAFKRVRIRSNLGRLLKILLISDIILWILLLFYPLISSIGSYSNVYYSASQPWNSFILYFLQPALNIFFILNIHLVTLMAANQYLMYAFPRMHMVWRRKKYILKYVLIIDFFIIASLEYTMLKWLEVTRYQQTSHNFYDKKPRDIYYTDVVANPSDNYISYKVSNNLILVIAPLIFLIFLSFSNLRFYLQNKWLETVTNGKKVSPKLGTHHHTDNQPHINLRNNADNEHDIQTTATTSSCVDNSGAIRDKTPEKLDRSSPVRVGESDENIQMSRQDVKAINASKHEEKLLSILIIILSFQYLVCNIPIAVIQILYPVYECYPGLCRFRFYVLIASMLQYLNPNIDFYIFYGLKSLRRAVGNLWTSTKRKKQRKAGDDKENHFDSSSTLDEADGVKTSKNLKNRDVRVPALKETDTDNASD